MWCASLLVVEEKHSGLYTFTVHDDDKCKQNMLHKNVISIKQYFSTVQ